MEEKKQFDELLGGSEKLPKDAHILKLAAARSSEIAAMTYSLGNINKFLKIKARLKFILFFNRKPSIQQINIPKASDSHAAQGDVS